MKSIRNNMDDIVNEMVLGMAKAFPNTIERIGKSNSLARRVKKDPDKVALISGGGSGHEPAHGGYVGYGMLDAAVAGDVFTSPTPHVICEAAKATGCKQILMIVKNYAGDVMNFKIAKETLIDSGYCVESVLVADDIALDDSELAMEKRGIAGTIFYHKILGAAAEKGYSLEELVTLATKIRDNIATMGVALSGSDTFEGEESRYALEEDEMEIGVGIHGEPGIGVAKLLSSKDLARTLSDRISDAISLKKGDRCAVLVNGLGSTTLMELYVAYGDLWDCLTERGAVIAYPLVGEYMTSLFMHGLSFSVLKVDEEMEEFLKFSVEVPVFFPREGIDSTCLFIDNVEDAPLESVEEKGIKSEPRGKYYTSRNALDFFRIAKESFQENEEYLNDLDGRIGDADHGRNMKKGFEAVEKALFAEDFTDIGKLFRCAGITILEKVGGASGALYGMGFVKAAHVFDGVTEYTEEEMEQFLIGLTEEIEDRGKAVLGDKTIVDVLRPATEAFEQAVKQKENPFVAAAKTAKEFATKTVPMRAKKGRASYLGERSIGTQDPGATSCMMIFSALERAY